MVLKASRICTLIGMTLPLSARLNKNKLFLKCQISRANDAIHLEQEKPISKDFYFGYLSSYFGKILSVLNVNVCYNETCTTRRRYAQD